MNAEPINAANVIDGDTIVVELTSGEIVLGVVHGAGSGPIVYTGDRAHWLYGRDVVAILRITKTVRDASLDLNPWAPDPELRAYRRKQDRDFLNFWGIGL